MVLPLTRNAAVGCIAGHLSIRSAGMVACCPFGPAGEFAASRHGALTRSQAADHGLTSTVVRRLLRDQALSEPVPGVLVVSGTPSTWRQQLYVATLASRGAGVAAIRSAAALHGIDGFVDGPLEVFVPSYRHIILPAIVVRRATVEPADRVEVDGIRCTNIARTLCDIGSFERGTALPMAFEWAWRNGVSLEWLRRTALRLDAPRRPGPRRVLELVGSAALHGRPTESALEVAVERCLAGLPGVVRQHEVRDLDGALIARVDFAIPELKIAIEAHSRRHHFGPLAEEHDASREASLQAGGWIVRFITDAQRRRPAELLASLTALVASRQASIGVCGSSTR